MLTLADLGVLREVSEEDGKVIVSITPTYTGCPAMDTMRDDLVHALQHAGYHEVEVRTVLQPPWSTDWISADGKRKLAAAGIAPPGEAPRGRARPGPAHPRRHPFAGCAARAAVPPDTEEVSRFSAHRLQGTAPLRRLPGTIRARQGDLR